MLFDLPSTLSCCRLCHVNNFAHYPCVDNLSLGTLGMSGGFQAKISLLSRRKLVSTSSYFAERWALMVAVLEGSPVPRSICLTSASFGGARILGFLAGISSSSGLIFAAIVAISFLQLTACAFATI